jgi:hypothetical protein
MAPQTTYLDKPPVAFAGQLADIGPKYAVTGVNEETVAIPFGLGMTKGTAEGKFKLPTLSTDKIHGIGIHSHDVDRIGSTEWPSEAGIEAAEDFSVLEDGRIYVKVEEAVNQHDTAYCRFALGALLGRDQLGAWRKSADAVGAWAGSTAYTVGQRVVNDTGKLYECITAGTSAASGGPTGTSQDITDGTAHWKYVQAQATGATAAIAKGAVFGSAAAAGGFAVLSFNKVVNLS